MPTGQRTPPENWPAGAPAPQTPAKPGFRERGGLRRRLRFLRKTRELAYRDLGGLVFEMHRLGQRRDDLVAGKLGTLERIDGELRAIETALRERRTVTVLREAGITACARCAAIHSSEDRFCHACGFSMSPHAERPIAAATVATPPPSPGAVGPPASPSSPLTAAHDPLRPAAATSAPATPAPTATTTPPHDPDQPTQIVESPTQIVRPAAEPPAERTNLA